jgi:hypothetical protein
MHLRTGTTAQTRQDQLIALESVLGGADVLMLDLSHPKALLRTHPRSTTCCAGPGVLPPAHHQGHQRLPANELSRNLFHPWCTTLLPPVAP